MREVWNVDTRTVKTDSIVVTSARAVATKIQDLENQLQEERSARKELELLIEKKAFSIETVKGNDMDLRTMSSPKRETAAHLDYQNIENLGEIKHRYKSGPGRALTVENEYFLVLCSLKVGLLVLVLVLIPILQYYLHCFCGASKRIY